MDCGIVGKMCKKCAKSFPRAKDAVYHEKHCGECAYSTCGKVFSNKLSLRSPSKTHEETNVNHAIKHFPAEIHWNNI